MAAENWGGESWVLCGDLSRFIPGRGPRTFLFSVQHEILRFVDPKEPELFWDGVQLLKVEQWLNYRNSQETHERSA